MASSPPIKRYVKHADGCDWLVWRGHCDCPPDNVYVLVDALLSDRAVELAAARVRIVVPSDQIAARVVRVSIEEVVEATIRAAINAAKEDHDG